MRKHRWKLMAALLALPALGWAEDAPAPRATPSFDIHGASVQNIISTTAASQYGGYQVPAERAASEKPAATPAVVWQPPEPAPITTTPGALDHFDCDARECVARDQDHAAMYTVPREYPENEIHDDRSFTDAFLDDLVDNAVVGLLEGLFGRN